MAPLDESRLVTSVDSDASWPLVQTLPTAAGPFSATKTPRTFAPVSDMADVVIVGGGGHAAVLLDVLQRLGRRVIDFTAPNLNGARISVLYLSLDEALSGTVDPVDVLVAIGFGKIRPNDRRIRVLRRLMKDGVRFPAFVAPTASVDRRWRDGRRRRGRTRHLRRRAREASMMAPCSKPCSLP